MFCLLFSFAHTSPVVAFSPVSTPRTSKTVSPIKIEGVSPLSTPGRAGVELEQRETESVCTEEVGQEEDEDEDEAGEFSDTSEEELVDAGEVGSRITKIWKLICLPTRLNLPVFKSTILKSYQFNFSVLRAPF